MSIDDRSTVNPEKTPLLIGTGVTFEGTVRHAGPTDERAVILGNFTGNIEWEGILQVPKGGKLVVEHSLRCREIVVGGEIVGAEATIEAAILRMGPSASVDVQKVSLPPGGLQADPGSVFNGHFRQHADAYYAQRAAAAEAQAAAAAPVVRPTLVAVSNDPPAATTAALAEAGSDEGPGVDDTPPGQNSLVQIETRTSAAIG